MAADAVLPRPLAKAIQYDAFGQASGPDVTDSQRLDGRVGVGNEAATETANFFFLHDPEIDQFLRHPLRRHLFLEGNECATHHGKLIHRYDAAAREESVNSTGIDGARLAQVTQEIAPVDLAVALAPQVEKVFTSGQEETGISLNGVRALDRRWRAASGEMFSDLVRMVTRRRARMGPVLVSAFSMGVIRDVTLLNLLLTLNPHSKAIFSHASYFQ